MLAYFNSLPNAVFVGTVCPDCMIYGSLGDIINHMILDHGYSTDVLNRCPFCFGVHRRAGGEEYSEFIKCFYRMNYYEENKRYTTWYNYNERNALQTFTRAMAAVAASHKPLKERRHGPMPRTLWLVGHAMALASKHIAILVN